GIRDYKVTGVQTCALPIFPYPVYVYAGLLPWLFLQASITNGGMSLISQQNLLSKIYLPRLFMPAATIGGGLIDMSLSFIVLCGEIGRASCRERVEMVVVEG